MRKRNLFEGAAVVLGILMIPFWCAASARAPHSAERSHPVSYAFPFSFEQVLSYFDDAFGKPAYKFTTIPLCILKVMPQMKL